MAGADAVRVIFLGPPGVGKGTQAARLATHLEIPKISTGDMLRTAIAEGTPLGREAAPLMERGDLVPDGLLIKLIDERIRLEDCVRGYILDGFPRTLPQAEGFEKMLDPRAARSLLFKIDVPRELLLGRLSGRRWCPRCQATFHVLNNPPRREGVCDRCGASLIQREDDKEAVVAWRLHEYDERTRPVTRYYERAGDVHHIDGDRPVGDVFADIMQVVGVERAASRA